MKWVLIGLALSTWDNHVVSHHSIATYDAQNECEAVANKANKKIEGIFLICANESSSNSDNYEHPGEQQ